MARLPSDSPASTAASLPLLQVRPQSIDEIRAVSMKHLGASLKKRGKSLSVDVSDSPSSRRRGRFRFRKVVSTEVAAQVQSAAATHEPAS